MDILLFSTRLCLIACRHLVPHYYNGELVKASDIAKIYSFNVRSLNPSFTALVKSGILESRKGGNTNGFIFAKDPKDVTLYDIVSVLEGEQEAKCCNDVINCITANCNDCDIHVRLQSVVEARYKILNSTTIYEQYEKVKNINI